MKKPAWKSMTFWGTALLALGGALEALGFSGAISVMSNVLGVPLTAFGIRRAL